MNRRTHSTINAATEDSLELHEGLAEYTGVVVGRPEPAARIEAALQDLGAHVGDPIEFDPRAVLALGARGSVYPSLRVVDDWGVLEVTGGALSRPTGPRWSCPLR